MRKSLQAILFLKPFSLGMLAPVLILVLTTHGATLVTASLFKGIAAFVIIAAEFPSGVFADLYGRKRAFLVSLCLQIAGFSLLLLSRSAGMLAAALTLYGLSRAFASGSIEALAIDTLETEAQISRAASRLNILEGAGLALGALAGGFLAEVGTRYTANVLAALCGAAVLLLLTMLTVRESAHIQSRGRKAVPRLKDHLRESFAFVLRSRVVRMLFILVFFTGFAMVSVETFWQPALQDFHADAWMFGAVNSAGFAGVILGSKAAEFLLTRRLNSGVAVFLISKGIMSLFLALFIAASARLPFVSVYVLWYVFLGGNGVAEQTLLNRRAPAAQRASILSLFSFALQIGSLLAAPVGFLVSSHMDYRYTWPIAAGILGAVTLVYAAHRRTRTD